MTETEFTSHLAVVRSLLWFHARRLSRGRDAEADDLFQSAVLALWTDRHKAASHPTPSKWFAQAGRWAMLRHLERSGVVPSFDPDTIAVASIDPPPDEFDTLVGLLPAEVRPLAVSRFADGRTLNELAADLGVTPAAVRQRLETAFEQVRGRLAG